MTDIDAIVLAAGQGRRLGLGPKTWLALGGRTLIERAVTVMRQVTDRVIVGVATGDVERARALCGPGAVVVPGGVTHRETMLAALQAGRAPLVLVHDVAHPFVSPELAKAVIAVARERGAAVAAVPGTSSAYRVAPGAAPMRLASAGEVWLVRRPFAFRRDDFARGVELAAADAPLSVILARVGVSTALVPAPSWNIKLTTPDDWTVAQALARDPAPPS